MQDITGNLYTKPGQITRNFAGMKIIIWEVGTDVIEE
jgi:hypothetical protein